MDDQPTAGGILAREWRVLKPLSAMLVASVLVLGFAVWVYPAFKQPRDTPQPDRAPLQVVINQQEKLSPAEIEFEQPKDIHADNEDTVPGLKPVLVYRVSLKAGGKSFSHPYTLNFMGPEAPYDLFKQGTVVVARLEGNSWKRLERSPQGHAKPDGSHWWAAEVEGPGTFALCLVKE